MTRLKTIRTPSFPCGKCCRDMTINPMHLLHPEQMSDEGREFVEATGILHREFEVKDVKPDGSVYLLHTCQHLKPGNRCDIYATRPTLCRTFDCQTRNDCTADVTGD